MTRLLYFSLFFRKNIQKQFWDPSFLEVFYKYRVDRLKRCNWIFSQRVPSFSRYSVNAFEKHYITKVVCRVNSLKEVTNGCVAIYEYSSCQYADNADGGTMFHSSKVHRVNDEMWSTTLEIVWIRFAKLTCQSNCKSLIYFARWKQ